MEKIYVIFKYGLELPYQVHRAFL